MATVQGRALPAKESGVFKSILKFYEHKQYKKGLKSAEQILRKFPDHGETLAMKGLFLSHLDKKEEAHEFIKKGLKNDLRSHICWHVYGLLHRADKNYEEAIKCYSHALKYDKENMQIIRDYSLLQIQMRNYEGFNDTRQQMLTLKPANRMYWIGLAISYHLLQKYETAEKVLTSFEESLNETAVDGVVDFENSELALYKNMIIEESGDYPKALEHLKSCRSKVVDQRAWKEARARLLLLDGKNVEAEVEYRNLIKENPDCHLYLEGLLRSRGFNNELDDVSIEKVTRLLNELRSKYPRSHVIKRSPLKYAKGASFATEMDEYLRPMFRKGVPSLYISLKDLYTDTEKAAIIEDLVVGYAATLKSVGLFAKDDTTREPPSAYLWVLYFLAQHFDKKRDTAKALELIDEAIEHTPTLVELLMCKARILKHGGDPASAMKVLNEARQLDLQDRFVNTKCTKYMLRNDDMLEAEKTISLFTRSQTDSEPLSDLVDMQCMWFALESGKSYVRQGKPGRALKKFHQIERHFVDIYDDQFDFHSYSLRKMTLRSYIDLLRSEDVLRRHPFYFQAAVSAVKVYVGLHTGPSIDDDKENAAAALSAAERKKALRKAKKAELKAGGAPGAADKNATDSAAAAKKKNADADPEGAKLVNVDHLAEATKFLRPLLELSPGRIESQVLGCEVYLHKKKYLLALHALKKAVVIDAAHPDLHRNLLNFYLAYTAATDLPAPVRTVIEAELPSLFGSSHPVDVAAFSAAYAASHKTSSAAHVLAAAEGLVIVDEGKREEGAALVDGIKTEDLTLEVAITINRSLNRVFKDSKRAADFRAKAQKLFPYAVYFKDV
ncbi:NMDA receptor-regulated protein 1-domain-containing protein [Blyttiomyces helicus]|uniref:NMDA receptor-regulated protein 1-domain-containing protein n=1 Tax=Blyttiomyces helicus TaxID=388810 RepID=A0A4P9WQL5_9FUNG|nr:NMDA receptor-regulated protein 1-domain-containing protein [Blyttiomyces helicus]|eukprot:RKO93510.1 NMDA receptor-regulated protein 1-domain-containing protein [Blyttiomyces helicus]